MIFGGGSNIIAMGFVGARQLVGNNIPASLEADVLTWLDLVSKKTAGKMGFLQNVITHRPIGHQVCSQPFHVHMCYVHMFYQHSLRVGYFLEGRYERDGVLSSFLILHHLGTSWPQYQCLDTNRLRCKIVMLFSPLF